MIRWIVAASALAGSLVPSRLLKTAVNPRWSAPDRIEMMTRIGKVATIFFDGGAPRGVAMNSGQLAASALPPAQRFSVTLPAGISPSPLNGRLFLLISNDSSAEPRYQINGGDTQLMFAIDVDDWASGSRRGLGASAYGYPIESLKAVPKGHYRVQAMLNRYEVYHRADGKVVKLAPDMGEGQHWNIKPGNLYSAPKWIDWDPKGTAVTALTLDQKVPPIEAPKDTRYVRHERIQSELLTRFWGKPTFIGAHILLPEGFDSHPEAHYPLVIDHGHFPADFEGWRETPPDPDLKPDSSTRFRLSGYNRIVEEAAWQLHQDWTGPNFPRVLLIQIQHPTQYYDDSYEVNSENNGPYGDAIMRELIPYLEKKYRGIGQGYARFAYGGSTGGWEALAVQVFYPDEFNGTWAACPDPIDFRAYGVTNIYSDTNAYFTNAHWKRTQQPAMRDYLSRVLTSLAEWNHFELAMGTHGRSGEQWDIWQAVFSPVGADGYPKPIWDKETGKIDPQVAEYWREHYDLSYIIKRDWPTLGPKLKGKIHIYVGEADNYFLNDAVYFAEERIRTLTNPDPEAEIDYGVRAEHCWNGDHTRGNAWSRLRYPQMFIPRIMDQIRKRAPAGADTVSWRY